MYAFNAHCSFDDEKMHDGGEKEMRAESKRGGWGT